MTDGGKGPLDVDFSLSYKSDVVGPLGVVGHDELRDIASLKFHVWDRTFEDMSRV